MFRALQADGHELVGVAAPIPSTEDEPMDALFRDAYLADVPVTLAGTLRAHCVPEGTELIVAAFCQDFIGAKTLRRARYGGIGYHPSLLPRHRGRDAIEWTVRMKDPIAGGSVYWLTERCDGGPIAAQDWCFVLDDDDARELYRRELFPMGVRLLRAVVGEIEGGKARRRPQNEAAATWEPSIGRPPIYRPELLELPPGSPDKAP